MPKKASTEYDEAGAPVSKVCTGCLVRLPAVEFGLRMVYGVETLRTRCIPCTKVYDQERYAKKLAKPALPFNGLYGHLKHADDEINHPDDRNYDWDAILQRDGWGNHDFF